MNNFELYKNQVALLLRILPNMIKYEDFALHGGTAINLLYKDMPRYSVDLDITYIPILDRETTINNINGILLSFKKDIEKSIRGVHVRHIPTTCKLICGLNGSSVKIEVNMVKRGLLYDSTLSELSPKVQKDFSAYCRVNTVSLPQLYGGKLSACLSRQHPRDIFDYAHMDIPISEIKEGLIYAIIGGDKPILEYLNPNLIDQSQTLENQFSGMTATPFYYKDYEFHRERLIKEVNSSLTDIDKAFLLSFETGEPDWSLSNIPHVAEHPSVKWKVQNINKLKEMNYKKYEDNIKTLKDYLYLSKEKVDNKKKKGFRI